MMAENEIGEAKTIQIFPTHQHHFFQMCLEAAVNKVLSRIVVSVVSPLSSVWTQADSSNSLVLSVLLLKQSFPRNNPYLPLYRR